MLSPADERAARVLRYRLRWLYAEARESFSVYRSLINPTLMKGWFRSAIEADMQHFWDEFEAGRRPKMILATPPQHGKSILIIDFLSWVAGKNPDLRTIFASFSDRLGVRANLRLQRIFQMDEYKRIFPATRINEANASVSKGRYLRNSSVLEFVGRHGYFRNTTVGGSITGDSLDCVVEGTLITTDIGRVCVEDINTGGRPVKALSFNGKSLSYERITSVTRSSSIGIYKITSKSGRFFEATAGHLVFTRNRGYVEASLLSRGDILVRAVRKKLSKEGLRCFEVDKGRREKTLLFKYVLSEMQVFAENHTKSLCGLWRNVQSTGCGLRDLLSGVLGTASNSSHCSLCASSAGGDMSGLSANIRVEAPWPWAICNLLLEKVCGTRAFKKHVGKRKSHVEAWGHTASRATTFRKSIPQSKKRGAGARWISMCALFGFRKTACPSHRWMADEQLLLKPCDAVPKMSRLCAQDDDVAFDYVEDAVEAVERSRESAVTYDLTVANNHNFFANDLLVHNCGVIDDPIKGREEAGSETMREKTWLWYTDDFSTRFSNMGALLMIMTRWHIDDLAGRIIEVDPTLMVRTYKAIAEEDEAHRKQGEPLFPELKSVEFLEDRKRQMRLASWNSLYQGSPIVDEGELFKPDQIRMVDLVPGDVKQSVRYWDKAGTEGGGAYTAGVLMHLTREDRIVIADVRRGQWSTGRREDVIRQTAELDGVDVQVWIEQESGSGGKESAEATLKRLSGFTVKAEAVTGSKVTRAEPFAAQVENGNVMMLRKPWNKELIDEMRLFPNGKYKDQVDAASGAFNKLTLGKSTLGVFEFYEREHSKRMNDRI